MPQDSVSGSFKAQLTETSESLTVGQFVPELAQTPGNVGICLSGGGSRALSAGMGQLRALSYLQLDGQSLLSQTKAISTVSGGSWLGVTFEFLTSGTSDSAFLNDYVPDQGQLVPTAEPGHPVAEILDELPEGNIGVDGGLGPLLGARAGRRGLHPLQVFQDAAELPLADADGTPHPRALWALRDRSRERHAPDLALLVGSGLARIRGDRPQPRARGRDGAPDRGAAPAAPAGRS